MWKMGLKGVVKTVNYNSYHGQVGETAPDLIIEEYVRRDGQTHHRSDFTCGGPDREAGDGREPIRLPVGQMLPQPGQGHVHGRDRLVRPEPEGRSLPDQADAGRGLHGEPFLKG